MDRLQTLAEFLAVVEEGSYTAAARKLGTSKSQISKHVQALEAHLGARLFHRTTRRLSLTEPGSQFAERARQILDALEHAEREAGDLYARPRGRLRLNVPMSFGRLHLGQAMPEFLRRYSDLKVDVSLNDRYVDLVEDGFDAAIRIGELADSSLIARRIAVCERWVCGAPDYLARHGRPTHPDALKDHRCLLYAYSHQHGEWEFQGPDGQRTSIPVEGDLRANNGEFLVEAASNGAGLILTPDFIAADAVRSGRLRRLLPEWELLPLNIYVVYPYTREVSAKVRAFVDFLVECFGGDTPPWRLDNP